MCDSPAISVDGKLLADGKRLLSCYEDGSVRLWSLKDEKSVEITTGAGSATYLDVHHSLPVAVIGDLVGRCYLVSMETAKVLRIFNVTERTEVIFFSIVYLLICGDLVFSNIWYRNATILCV